LKEKERGPLLLSEYMVELIYVLCISIQKERKIKAYLDVRGGLWRVWRVVGAEAERETIWDRDRAGQNRIISSSVATEMILLLFDWDFPSELEQLGLLGFNGSVLLYKSWAPRLRMEPIPRIILYLGKSTQS
jgi:hypothetical protein